MSHDLQFSVEGGSPEKSGNFSGPMTSGAVGTGAGAGGTSAPTGLAQSSHPFVCIFHILFKAGSIF